MMKLCVDGVGCDLGCATFSEKSYGKVAGVEIPFSLEADVADFFARFAPVYDECIAELRRDDAVTGEFHAPYPGASDYPSLEELLRLAVSDRMKFLDTYLVLDILRLYFEEEAAGDEVRWVIERCDSFERQDERLFLRGVVRPYR